MPQEGLRAPVAQVEKDTMPQGGGSDNIVNEWASGLTSGCVVVGGVHGRDNDHK